MDWICGYSLKLAAIPLISELTVLTNLSIKEGKFYSGWKKTKVLPGFKNKGSRCDAKFYRPISNISEVSKIPEKVVHEQVYDHLMEHNLIHPNHHGFLSHHSTASALQQIIDIWLKSADKGKLSAGLFLDLSAGFDVINVDILLKKLKLYNFDDYKLLKK